MADFVDKPQAPPVRLLHTFQYTLLRIDCKFRNSFTKKPMSFSEQEKDIGGFFFHWRTLRLAEVVAMLCSQCTCG
jgi:hypothetical protein